MKKAILPLLALLPFIFFSCNDKKKAEPDTKDVSQKTENSTEPAESRSILGKWKMAEWNDPGILLNAEEKQKVMDATEVEITADGKWITRAEGKEKTYNYTYYENTQTLKLPDNEGKIESLRISFAGNRMTLAGEKGSVVLERL